MSGTPFSEPWPPGVVARYLSLAGALVDIHEDPETRHSRYAVTCPGCVYWRRTSYEPSAHEWAQEHAATCRALPRPAGVHGRPAGVHGGGHGG